MIVFIVFDDRDAESRKLCGVFSTMEHAVSYCGNDPWKNIEEAIVDEKVSEVKA